MFYLKNLLILFLLTEKFCWSLLQLTNSTGDIADELHNVTLEECENAVNTTLSERCCSSLSLFISNATKSCVKAVRPEKSLYGLCLLGECVFDYYDYIKSDTQMDTHKIKADTKKLYKKNKAQRNFVVNAFKECFKEATGIVAQISNTTAEEVFKKLHKPYFCFTFQCLVKYNKKKCPFFTWNGKTSQESKACLGFAKQCKKTYFPKVNLFNFTLV